MSLFIACEIRILSNGHCASHFLELEAVELYQNLRASRQKDTKELRECLTNTALHILRLLFRKDLR